MLAQAALELEAEGEASVMPATTSAPLLATALQDAAWPVPTAEAQVLSQILLMWQQTAPWLPDKTLAAMYRSGS